MKIFVYGTLKKNCCNHHILKNKETKYISDVFTKEKYPMYKSEYYFPYLENQKGEGKILKGELFEVAKNDLIELDRFEGVPDLYKRGKIDLIDKNSKEYKDVLVYFKTEETNLKDIEFIDEWIEQKSGFNIDDYTEKMLNK